MSAFSKAFVNAKSDHIKESSIDSEGDVSWGSMASHDGL